MKQGFSDLFYNIHVWISAKIIELADLLIGDNDQWLKSSFMKLKMFKCMTLGIYYLLT